MPIKGLSDERRLPRAGKIHLGIKKEARSGSEYPSATDYFVVKADQSTNENAALAFHLAYGDTPRCLDILIPSLGETMSLADLKEIMFPQYYKQYGSGTGLKCKGDGQTAERMDADKTTGVIERRKVPCVGPETCPYVKRMSAGSGEGKPDCGPVAHLQVLLPKVHYLGIWQIDTGSEISIKQINSDLDLIYMAAGTVANIPLNLNLVPRQVSPGGRKKTVYTLSINYAGSLKELRLLSANKQAFLVDLIDDEEVPSDIRPPEALQEHPLAKRLAAPSLPAGWPPPAAKTSEALPTKPESLPAFEAAFGTEHEKDALPETAAAIEDMMGTAQEPTYYDLAGPPPEPTEDPLENGILFHAWRVGMTPAVLESSRMLNKTPERLCAALQKTPTPPTRVGQLAAMGYRADGMAIIEGGQR